jgi:hypothetical protein
VIEPPLVRRDAWNRDEDVIRLLLQYAALLEYYVARWPDQFRPGHLISRPAEPAVAPSGGGEQRLEDVDLLERRAQAV